MRIALIRRIVLPATIVLILTLASVSVLHAPSAPVHAASTFSGPAVCSSQRSAESITPAASCTERAEPSLAGRQR